MKISFKNKRIIYKLKQKFKHQLVINNREQKVIDIVKKHLRKETTDLIIAPLSMNRYITSGDKQLNIILTGTNAIISNHSFHYDISLDKDTVEILNKMFDRILESRRRIAEREILNNMLASLSILAHN